MPASRDPQAYTTSQEMVRSRESTENVPQSTRRKKDVSEKIDFMDPDAAPFTLLTKRMNKKPAHDTKFYWMEKELPPKWDQVNNAGAAYDASTTAVVVDNAKYFSVGDIVNAVISGEKLRVTAVDVATNTITVVRAVGNTAASAAGLANNADLQIIGSAYAEGSPLGLEKSHVERELFNYTQIHRTPFGATGTAEAVDWYTPKPKKQLLTEKGIEHKIDLERTALFGERNIDTTSTNNPRRYAGGALFYLADNIFDAGGTLTSAELWGWMQDVYNVTSGSDKRVLLAAPLLITVMDQLAIGSMQLAPGDKTWGISVTQFLTSHGTFNIIKHRLLANGVSGTAGYGGFGLLLDPSKWSYRPLPGRDTFHRPDVGVDGDDGWTDEYLTEAGFEVRASKTQGVIKGVTG